MLRLSSSKRNTFEDVKITYVDGNRLTAFPTASYLGEDFCKAAQGKHIGVLGSVPLEASRIANKVSWNSEHNMQPIRMEVEWCHRHNTAMQYSRNSCKTDTHSKVTGSFLDAPASRWYTHCTKQSLWKSMRPT